MELEHENLEIECNFILRFITWIKREPELCRRQ